MNKLNRILLGLFGLQLLIGVFVCTRGERGTLQKASPLLADLDADEVSKIQIFAAKTDDKTDSPAAIVLSKETDGWVVSSHHDYPADPAAVDALIGKLVAMKSRGAQTTSKSRHEQLEVAADKYQRKLVVTTPKGEHTVYLGTSPAFRQVAVRVDDSDKTYAVADITTGDADTQVSAWIDPSFEQVPLDRMQSVTIVNAAGTLALTRNPDLTWSLNGGAADQAKVEGLLGKLAEVNLADIAGVQAEAGWGLDKPQAQVTITLGDAPPPPEGVDTGEAPQPAGDTIVLEVGAEKDGRFYLRAVHKKHIVLVARATFEDFVAATPERLGAAPPPVPDPEAPTPKPGAPRPGAPQPKPPQPKPPQPKPPAPKPLTP
jgi:hypothetical protein